jgi:hypothetical protein
VNDEDFEKLEEEYENQKEDFFVICQTKFSENCLTKKSLDSGGDGKIHMMISKNDFSRWHHGGEKVQDVFTYLTADERELLISQTCGPCYDAMFPVEFPEDEEVPWFEGAGDEDLPPLSGDQYEVKNHLDPEIFPDGGYTA